MYACSVARRKRAWNENEGSMNKNILSRPEVHLDHKMVKNTEFIDFVTKIQQWECC